MSHALEQNVRAGSHPRGEEMSPPLMRGFVHGDHRGEIDAPARFLAPGQEADPFGERDVGGKPAGASGVVGKLAEPQLFPWIGPEPLGEATPRHLERLQDRVDVVRM